MKLLALLLAAGAAMAQTLPSQYAFKQTYTLALTQPSEADGMTYISGAILNGSTIAGPLLNATILGGSLAITIVGNSSNSQTSLQYNGLTNDGVSFSVRQNNVLSNTIAHGGQLVGIALLFIDTSDGAQVMSIGAAYASLSTGFIGCTIKSADDPMTGNRASSECFVIG